MRVCVRDTVDGQVEAGDIRSVPKDPWDNEYMYIPQLDWTLVSRALQVGQSEGTEREIRYYIDCINHVARMLSNLPERIDPMVWNVQLPGPHIHKDV